MGGNSHDLKNPARGLDRPIGLTPRYVFILISAVQSTLETDARSSVVDTRDCGTLETSQLDLVSAT